MGLLDKSLQLPKISAGINEKQLNYSVAPVETLVNESYTAVQKTYGGISNFNSLAVGAPSFRELGASAQLDSLPTTLGAYKNVAASLSTSVQTSTASASQIKEETGDGSAAQDMSHIVKLVSTLDENEIVSFEVMPEISENRNAEYEPLQAAQMPGEFQKFKGTKSVSWQVNATITCRTRAEATENFLTINRLRSWTMPYFGDKQGSTMMGAPPPVIKFSGWRGLVGTVPTVVTSLNWSWPKDCDWLPTNILGDGGKPVPFPTVINVQFTLVESYSASQFNALDLKQFRRGDFSAAFGGASELTDDVSVSESTMAEPQEATLEVDSAAFSRMASLNIGGI